MASTMPWRTTVLWAWVAVSILSLVTTIAWPAPYLSLLPLLVGALWIVSYRVAPTIRVVVRGLSIGFVSLFVALITVPVAVTGPEDATQVWFGWPFAWLAQDLSQWDPPYPTTALPQAWGEIPGGADIATGPLFASLAVHVIVAMVLLVGCRTVHARLRRRQRRRPAPEPVSAHGHE
jgi:hypothetical protein